MTATITKTFSYDAAAVRAMFAHLDNLPICERLERREAIKADAQRAWKKAGRPGPNPMVFL